MIFALSFFCIVLIVLSLYGALLPVSMLAVIDRVASERLGLTSAIIARVIFAALLWINAQHSYTPTTFKALAMLLLLSAIAHFIVGRNILKKFRHVLATLPLWVIRLPCFLGAAMGIFIMWSLARAAGIG